MVADFLLIHVGLFLSTFYLSARYRPRADYIRNHQISLAQCLWVLVSFCIFFGFARWAGKETCERVIGSLFDFPQLGLASLVCFFVSWRLSHSDRCPDHAWHWWAFGWLLSLILMLVRMEETFYSRHIFPSTDDFRQGFRFAWFATMPLAISVSLPVGYACWKGYSPWCSRGCTFVLLATLVAIVNLQLLFAFFYIIFTREVRA